DRLSDCEKLSQKILKFRIFGDEAGKMNLDVKEAGGEILSVPQFTLYGDTRKGNRPGFNQSAEPAEARVLWVQINTLLRGGGIVVKEGVFGAHMEVALVNEGPVTFWLDSKE
ncbi:D-tyrosyl-tRNA(Tyr) deacylase, partial [candidate division TA06 bacterium]|nr:D-tyrosyl-tRNA(Tyr) deacylase [candidate division TA06 bacterium]